MPPPPGFVRNPRQQQAASTLPAGFVRNPRNFAPPKPWINVEPEPPMAPPTLMESLGQTAGEWGDVISGLPAKVSASAANTVAGMRAAELEKLRQASVAQGAQGPGMFDAFATLEGTPEEQARLRGDLETELAISRAAGEDLMPTPGATIAQRGLETAGMSMLPSSAAMAVGLATRNPALAAGAMYGPATGASFAGIANEMADQEAQRSAETLMPPRMPDYPKALEHGRVEGLLEVGTEVLPFSRLLKVGTPGVQRLAEVLLAELPGETLATVTQSINQQLALAPEGEATLDTVFRGLEEGGKQIPETLVAAILGSAAQSAPFMLAGEAEPDAAPPIPPGRQALPPPSGPGTIEVTPEGVATTETDRINTPQPSTAERARDLGLGDDIVANLERLNERKEAALADQPPPPQLPAPPPLAVTPEGVAGPPGALQNEALQARLGEQAAMDEAAAMGLTPDVIANLERLQASQQPASVTPPLPALPAPDTTMYVDSAGRAGTPTQRAQYEAQGNALAAQAADEAEAMGFTADVQAASAAQQHRPPADLGDMFRGAQPPPDDRRPPGPPPAGAAPGPAGTSQIEPNRAISSQNEPQIEPKPVAPAIKRGPRPDERVDDVLEFISKKGGVSLPEAVAQGLDPADLRTAKGYGIRKVFTKAGMSFDAAAELLDEAGYPVQNPDGSYSANKVLDIITSGLKGQRTFSTRNQTAVQQAEQEREAGAQRAIDDRATSDRRAVTREPPPPPRRSDIEGRKRVEAMTPDERAEALLTSELTGLPNRRAYDERERLPVQAALDVDGLKWVNDNMGHASGDLLLQYVGDAIRAATPNGYHLSGDEFVIEGQTEQELADLMDQINERLSMATIEAEKADGERVTLEGIGVSYGLGDNLAKADENLAQSKTQREAQGVRAPRGEQPAGATRSRGAREGLEDSLDQGPDDELAQQRDDDAPFTVGEQQGDLFTAADQREGSNEKQLALANKLLAENKIAEEEDGPIKTVASAFASDYRRDHAASLIGKVMTSLKDLAYMAQIVRDPRYETLRYFYLDKNGKILGESAVSSRIPSASGAFPLGESGPEWVKKQMDGVGATRLVMLHNHPSGNAAPSPEDVGITKYMSAKLGIPVQHVVIDSNEYSLLLAVPDLGQDVGARLRERMLDLPPDKMFVASKPHPLLGTSVGSEKDLLALAQKGVGLKARDGWLTVIGVTAGEKNLVRTIGEVPASILKSKDALTKALQHFGRQSGSAYLFMLGVDKQWTKDNAEWIRKGINERLFRDIVYPDGTNARGETEFNWVNENKRMALGMQPELEARDVTPKRPAPKGDLFGEDVADKQALEDEKRRKDSKRSPNKDVYADTGRPGDLFTKSRQKDIDDGTVRESAGHGTKAKFAQFSMDFVGTGQGAQSFGHGIYFAQNPLVYNRYADDMQIVELQELHFDKIPFYTKGRPFDYGPIQSKPVARAMGIDNPTEGELQAIATMQESVLIAEWTFRQAFERGGEQEVEELLFFTLEQWANDNAEELGEEYGRVFKWLEKELDDDAGQVGGWKPRAKLTRERYVYEVEIADEAIATMLDWDAPLNEQNDLVKNVLRDILKDTGFLGRNDNGPIQLRRAFDEARTRHLDMASGNKGSDVYELIGYLAGPKTNYDEQRVSATRWLLSGGVKGNIYKDAGSRKPMWVVTTPNGVTSRFERKPIMSALPKGSTVKREQGGTSNFVVFDPSVVTIKKINGKPVTQEESDEIVDNTVEERDGDYKRPQLREVPKPARAADEELDSDYEESIKVEEGKVWAIEFMAKMEGGRLERRALGEGPWDTKLEAEEFLHSEVGAKGARVYQTTFKDLHEREQSEAENDDQVVWEKDGEEYKPRHLQSVPPRALEPFELHRDYQDILAERKGSMWAIELTEREGTTITRRQLSTAGPWHTRQAAQNHLGAWVGRGRLFETTREEYLERAKRENPGSTVGEQEGDDYRGVHQAPDKESGAPLHDMTKLYPDDLYGQNGLRYYGGAHEGDMEARAHSIILEARNRPNMQVRVYRAIPKGVKGKAAAIKKGDWITTVREYAKMHGESALNGEFRIVTEVVRANEIYTEANSLMEYGYDPQPFDKQSWRQRRADALEKQHGADYPEVKKLRADFEANKVDEPDTVAEQSTPYARAPRVPSQKGNKGYAKAAQRVIDLWNKKAGWRWGALGKLPDQRGYLEDRYKALGRVAAAQEIGRAVYDSLQDASAADAQAVYNYMTSRNVDPSGIADPATRRAAIKAKGMIDTVGKRLVQLGLLSKETYERHAGEYLPRVYLKHLLGDDAFKFIGGGKKPDLGWMKRRKDIPEEVRRVLMGEITDPAFLASFGLSRTLRDIALLDFLETIAGNAKWTPPGATVQWNGKNVSPFWLHDEAARLRTRARLYKPADKTKAMELAEAMDEVVDAAMTKLGNADKSGFSQVPNTPRYGALRGMWVRKEIYNDLVGAQGFIEPDASVAETLFGQGGALTKVNQWWKFSKVVLNPPTQVRNFLSNLVLLHLSGVPARRVFSGELIGKAINSIVTKDKYFQIAKKYGLFATTFSNQEGKRISDEWLAMQKIKGATGFSRLRQFATRMAGEAVNKAGDFYGFMEAVGKIAKLRDAMDREGKSAPDAMLDAHEALFDYSLVPRSVQYLRNAPLGAPFITFMYKALGQMTKTAIKHPARFAPYAAIPYLLSELLQNAFDVDDDDIDKLRKAFPAWMRERGHMLLLPWKDDNGRWQVADMGYLVPWGSFANLIAAANEGKGAKELLNLVALGGPLSDVTAAIETNTDPFTGEQIVRETDPPADKLQQLMQYVWNLAMPGFMTEDGAINQFRRAARGVVNRRGEPGQTRAQAAARLFGINLYPVDPASTRAANLRAMRYDLQEKRTRMRELLRDRNLTDAERTDIAATWSKILRADGEAISDYAAETEIHPNLEVK